MTSLALHAPAWARPRLSPALQGMVWGAVAVAIWGVYLAFSRLSIRTGVAPADLAFVRYVTAGLIMLPWLLRHRPAGLAGIGWGRALGLSLVAGPLFILVGASGFHFAPLAHGAVVQPAAVTIGGLVLGAWLLRLYPSRAGVIGAAVIVAGLALVAGPGLLSGGVMALRGDALFAAAGVMWAAFAVLSRRWNVSPIAATAVVSVLSGAIYGPIYLTTTGLGALLAQPLTTLAEQILVQGVLSGVVAVFAFGRAVELLGAPRAAAFPAMVPAVAIVIGVPLTGEWPTALQIAGLMTVTLGLVLSQRRPA